MKMESVPFLLPENREPIHRSRTVSYTHLDVYKRQQHAWMDRPEEKVENSIHLKTISRNFRGYLLSLEEKKKEAEWNNY